MSFQGFRIPKCFKPECYGRVARAELHHFADASKEKGYGTDTLQFHCRTQSPSRN